MTKPLPFITQEQRKGIKILLDWCIKKYQKVQSPVGKRLWHEKKEFLAELQKKQSYTEEDKVIFNGIRKQYFTEKFLDKHADLSKGTL